MSSDVSDRGARKFSEEEFKEAPSDELLARTLQSEELSDDLSGSADPVDPNLTKVEAIMDEVIEITNACIAYVESEENPRARLAFKALRLESEAIEKNIRKFKDKDAETNEWLAGEFADVMDDLDEKLSAISVDRDFSLGESLVEANAPVVANPDEVLPRETILLNRAAALQRPTTGGANRLRGGRRVADMRAACRTMSALKADLIHGREGASGEWWNGFETVVGILEDAQANDGTEYSAFFRAGIVDLVSGLLAMMDGGLVCNEELPDGILGKL